MYKNLSNILLSRLTLYAEEIIGDHHCGFRHKATIGHMSVIVKYLKKWEFIKAEHQLFIDLQASDSVTGEVLYNILIVFGIPMKLLRLIKCIRMNPRIELG